MRLIAPPRTRGCDAPVAYAGAKESMTQRNELDIATARPDSVSVAIRLLGITGEVDALMKQIALGTPD